MGWRLTTPVLCWWSRSGRCVGTRLGLKVGNGGRHLAANLGVSAVLLGLYQGALVLAA